ncbi:MAG: cupin domain-containing protein [Deltaproteobacteria bacterium]|nr:cupin domain-containing protein [Deltaproteobacteria bacterium]
MSKSWEGEATVFDVNAALDFSEGGIVSKTLYAGDDARVVLFGFDAGQELTEHTAAVPALLHVLEGEGEIDLAGEKHPVGPGFYTRMPAHLPHSVKATGRLALLLVLLRSGKPKK